MNALRLKLAICLAVAMLVAVITPAAGFTVSETDERQGVVIDFGYWETSWIPLSFYEGEDAVSALEEACSVMGWDVIFNNGEVFSIDGEVSLVGVKWGFYVLDKGSWAYVEDPGSRDISGESAICWARASGADSVIPGTDATGFMYYSYGTGGRSLSSGADLRVISLAPSVTETVAYVGGADLIVGTDIYSNYPEEVAAGRSEGKISVVGGYTDPNYEWIVRLAPDIVFCDGGTGEHVTIADRLRKSGIDCVVLYNATDVESLYDNMWITAAALGLSENANSVITAARSTFDVLRGVIGLQPVKRVFVSLSADPSPWTSGSDTFMSDMVSGLSGSNIFDTASSWFMVSKEQIHTKQPEVIIIIGDSKPYSEDSYMRLLDSLDPLWKETPAYRNGEVYVFSGKSADILSRPGPRLAEAAELIAKILHPGPFTVRDPMDVVPKYFGDDYSYYLKYQRERL
ncbi:MAG: helical backbone metal receptor [Candidatus Methanoplasma sp.]|jgi:iron complex transport system substrate-binding protein|nr:helical backbone metal receptor [Candidatus Methanoplasma sp.]